jgi:hypothetical protein
VSNPKCPSHIVVYYDVVIDVVLWWFYCRLQELDYLDGAVSNPKRPFAAIVGGSKVSSKITVIESLLNKVDVLIIG